MPWTLRQRRVALLGAWVGVFGCASGFALWRRQARAQRAAATEPRAETARQGTPRLTLRKLARLVGQRGPLWKLPAARALLLCLAICARLAVAIRLSRLLGALGSLLSKRRWEGFASAQMAYAVWTVPGALLNALVELSSRLFALSLREQLGTFILERVAREGVLGALGDKVKDHDQRATADVDQLADETAEFLRSLFKPVAESIILSATLARMMGTRQLLKCYLYFALAASWTRAVTPQLTTLASRVQELGGAVRSGHARLRAFGEEIEFCRGERTEAAALRERSQALGAAQTVLASQRFLASALDAYAVRHMGTLVALSMMTPALKKMSTSERVEDPTGYFLTCLHLLVNLMGAFKDAAAAARSWGAVRGALARLEPLVAVMETPPDRASAAVLRSEAVRDIELEAVDVRAPGTESRLLMSGLSLRIKRGRSLFVEGPNAVGKTALFRVIAGLWAPGAGQVRGPALRDCMFLTQRPYLVPGLTLREQLLYPDLDDLVPEARLAEALAVASVPGHLDETKSYEELSSGEMQRLACARVLARRPAFAFVDEALGSCTEAFELEFVRHCLEHAGVTLVTVSHRAVSRSLHADVLQLDTEGRVAFWGPTAVR